MTTTETIIIPIAIGLLFAEFSGIPQSFGRWLFKIGLYRSEQTTRDKIYKLPYRLKPFDCGLCLTFWIALAQNILTGNSVYLSVGFAALSSCISYLIITINARINR